MARPVLTDALADKSETLRASSVHRHRNALDESGVAPL